MATERERIEAIRQILIQLYGLIDSGIPSSRIGRIEREAIYFIYEAEDGKFPEARPHSAAARQIRRAANGRLTSKNVTYDHAIPLARLRQGLRAATASYEAMETFLKRFLQGVAITRDEDKKLNDGGWRSNMPGDAANDDLMARYRHVGIAFEPNDEAILRRNSKMP
jgi:hypothetical protein